MQVDYAGYVLDELFLIVTSMNESCIVICNNAKD